MHEPPIAVEIHDLTKTYLKHRTPFAALDHVSLQIPLGQIFCLLGPNGSGKTTLLKVLAGLLRPTSGTATVMGHDVAARPREAKSKIGWMPAEERSGFYGRLSGRQNLRFFGALHGLPEEELERAIGNLAVQLGIAEELDQTMLKTSGGARQKIGLARALLHNPPVLLLDEPMRNLDPHTVLRFRRLIRNNLSRLQKKTVLLSTHQLEEARRLADFVLILNRGAVVRMLSAQELERELQNTSVEELYMKIVDESAAV